MYSHSKRIINPNRKDEFYRTDLPSHSNNYYSTSSVYSYSPTSTSDCPEHGRKRKLQCFLTVAIVVATLGVISIVAVAAYLGSKSILSKNVSSNGSQYEESSHLLSNTNKLDRNSELIINNGRSRFDPSSSNVHEGQLDLTNSILDTKSTHEDHIRQHHENDDDLTQNVVSNKVLFSQKNSTSTVKKTSSSNNNYGQQRYPPIITSSTLSSSSSSSSTPSVPRPAVVSVSTFSTSNSNSNQHHHHYHSNNNEDSGPVIIRAPPTQPTINTHDRHHRNRYRNRYPPTNSHSLTPSTTTTLESVNNGVKSHDHHHHPHQVDLGGGGAEEVSTVKTTHFTEHSDISSSTLGGGGSINNNNNRYTKDDYENRNNNNNNKQNENLFRNEDLAGGNKKVTGVSNNNNEQHNNNNRPPPPTTVSSSAASSLTIDRNFDPERLKNHRGVMTMTTVADVEEPNNNSAEYFVPVNPLYKQHQQQQSSSSSSSIPPNHNNQDGTTTPLLNNHRVHLTFDRIAPEFYDKKPWTPLLNRPNLDKRPRVELIIPDSPTMQPVDLPSHHQHQIVDDTHVERTTTSTTTIGTTQVYYPPGTGDVSGHDDDDDNHNNNEPIRHASADNRHHDNRHDGIIDGGETAKTTTTMTTTTTSTTARQEENQNQSQPIPTRNDGKPPDIPSFTVYIPHIPSSQHHVNQNQSTVPNLGMKTDGQRDNEQITPTSSSSSSTTAAAGGAGTVWNLPLGQHQQAADNHHNDGNEKTKKKEEGDGKMNKKILVKSAEFDDGDENESGGKDEDYPDGDGDLAGEASPHSNIYKLDADNIDIVPDTLATAKPPLPPPIRDLRKEDNHQVVEEEGSPKEISISSSSSSSSSSSTTTSTTHPAAAHPVIDSRELYEEVPTISGGSSEEHEEDDDSQEGEEDSSEVSNMRKNATTDFLMSTLGSLHLMKTADLYETGSDTAAPAAAAAQPNEEGQHLEKHGEGEGEARSGEEFGEKGGSPLFPPVRSYVGINQPLRPKPTGGSSELLDDSKSFLVFENKPNQNGGGGDAENMQKKFRISTEDERDHLPDLTLTTTSSLNKVLSMMMNFQPKDNTPLTNISSQNVQLIVADNGQGIIVRNATKNDSPSSGSNHREPKLFSRDPKIDTRFHEQVESVEHVPVPLIKNEGGSGGGPSKVASNKTKISSLTVANSPVYKFVLRKGQSVEDLLKEIFHNFTEKASSPSSSNLNKNGKIDGGGGGAAADADSVKVSTTTILKEHVQVSSTVRSETKNHQVSSHSSLPSTTTARNPVSAPQFMATTSLFKTDQSSTAAPTTMTMTTTMAAVATKSTFDPPVITSTSITINENSMEPCPTNNSFRCVSNGKCISGFGRCNGIRECPDYSDEKGCLCVDHLRAQMLHRKICDGFVDCIDKSDENQCSYCSPGQYICSGSRTCVNRDKICDGVPNCPKRDDENECVKIGSSGSKDDLEDLTPTYHKTGHLMVRKKGVWGKLCVETFSTVVSHWEVKDLARAVCKALTFSDFETVERVEDEEVNSTEPYYELHYGPNNETDSSAGINSSESSPRSGLGFKQTTCKSKLVVKVTCQDLQCGTAPRAFIQTARIVGGSNALPGEWPWQAALYRDGEYQCGATLISSRWLLSAGHCFYHAQDDYWVARLGTLRRGATVLSPYEQVVRITHIFLHPQYKDVGFINDVSLLRLEHEVNFTDFVRPVCLPGRDTKIRDGRLCTVVGWGQLFEVGRVFPDTLQEVQLPLISTAECRKRTLFLPLYKLTDEMFCAGYDRGGRDACLGDSGGPLLCQESDGRWSLYGVTSNGYGCARANRPGVYTKVASYLDWIYDKMSHDKALTFRDRSTACEGHRCPLGECLEPHRLCNGASDCLDSSDERNCTWS